MNKYACDYGYKCTNEQEYQTLAVIARNLGWLIYDLDYWTIANCRYECSEQYQYVFFAFNKHNNRWVLVQKDSDVYNKTTFVPTLQDMICCLMGHEFKTIEQTPKMWEIGCGILRWSTSLPKLHVRTCDGLDIAITLKTIEGIIEEGVRLKHLSDFCYIYTEEAKT
jgi:hypothetical protein